MMRCKRRFLFFLPLLILLSTGSKCSHGDDLGVERNVDFATLELADGSEVKGSSSGLRNHQLMVIRDAAAFSDLWVAHTAMQSPPTAEPAVDFNTDMVIAVFAGEQNTGGYGIAVTDIRENDEFLMVDVEFTRPGEGCVVTQALTQPYHFVLLDTTTKPVNFNEANVTKACGQ